jgi:hypothetical protein
MFSVLLVSTLLALGGSMLGATSIASASPRPVSCDTCTAPGGATGVLGKHFTRYCVKSFKPGSTVTVTNETTGKSVTTTVDGNGAGCVRLPIKRECKALTQHFSATGTGANGKPATVGSVVTAPATASLCSSTSAGVLPFTGADNVGKDVLVGLALISIGGVAIAFARRPRRIVAAG